MLASIPASTLNQSLRDLEIPNRFTLKSSRFRLFVTGKKIDSDISHAGAGTELDIALAVLLALLGGSLGLYLSHAVLVWF